MHIKQKVPTIEVPFFYKLNLKKVNENSANHYIFEKVINQQDFFRRKTNYTTCTTYVLIRWSVKNGFSSGTMMS